MMLQQQLETRNLHPRAGNVRIHSFGLDFYEVIEPVFIEPLSFENTIWGLTRFPFLEWTVGKWLGCSTKMLLQKIFEMRIDHPRAGNVRIHFFGLDFLKCLSPFSLNNSDFESTIWDLTWFPFVSGWWVVDLNWLGMAWLHQPNAVASLIERDDAVSCKKWSKVWLHYLLNCTFFVTVTRWEEYQKYHVSFMFIKPFQPLWTKLFNCKLDMCNTTRGGWVTNFHRSKLQSSWVYQSHPFLIPPSDLHEHGQEKTSKLQRRDWRTRRGMAGMINTLEWFCELSVKGSKSTNSHQRHPRKDKFLGCLCFHGFSMSMHFLKKKRSKSLRGFNF